MQLHLHHLKLVVGPRSITGAVVGSWTSVRNVSSGSVNNHIKSAAVERSDVPNSGSIRLVIVCLLI